MAAPARDATAANSSKDVVAAEYLAEKVPAPESHEDIIELETLDQVRDMDDEEEEEEGGHSFSKEIVWNYFDQAEQTFNDMEDALKAEDLSRLSSLGHFLKGSSAALGIRKVTDTCEKIQHYGHCRDEEENVALERPEALRRIKKEFYFCMEQYRIARAWLKKLYGDES